MEKFSQFSLPKSKQCNEMMKTVKFLKERTFHEVQLANPKPHFDKSVGCTDSKNDIFLTISSIELFSAQVPYSVSTFSFQN